MQRIFITGGLVLQMVAPIASAAPTPTGPAADALDGAVPAVGVPARQKPQVPVQYQAMALNDALIHQAITDTLNATPAPNVLPTQATAISGGSSSEQIMARAFQDAKVEDCLHADAMKFDPPKIGPVMLTQAFAVPFWAYAILSGKCN